MTRPTRRSTISSAEVRFRVDQFPASTGEALPDLVDGHAGLHGRDPTATEAEHQKRRARRGGMGGASDVRGSPVGRQV